MFSISITLHDVGKLLSFTIQAWRPVHSGLGQGGKADLDVHEACLAPVKALSMPNS